MVDFEVTIDAVPLFSGYPVLVDLKVSGTVESLDIWDMCGDWSRETVAISPSELNQFAIVNADSPSDLRRLVEAMLDRPWVLKELRDGIKQKIAEARDEAAFDYEDLRADAMEFA